MRERTSARAGVHLATRLRRSPAWTDYNAGQFDDFGRGRLRTRRPSTVQRGGRRDLPACATTTSRARGRPATSIFFETGGGPHPARDDSSPDEDYGRAPPVGFNVSWSAADAADDLPSTPRWPRATRPAGLQPRRLRRPRREGRLRSRGRTGASRWGCQGVLVASARATCAVAVVLHRLGPTCRSRPSRPRPRPGRYVDQRGRLDQPRAGGRGRRRRPTENVGTCSRGSAGRRRSSTATSTRTSTTCPATSLPFAPETMWNAGAQSTPETSTRRTELVRARPSTSPSGDFYVRPEVTLEKESYELVNATASASGATAWSFGPSGSRNAVRRGVHPRSRFQSRPYGPHRIRRRERRAHHLAGVTLSGVASESIMDKLRGLDESPNSPHLIGPVRPGPARAPPWPPSACATPTAVGWPSWRGPDAARHLARETGLVDTVEVDGEGHLWSVRRCAGRGAPVICQRSRLHASATRAKGPEPRRGRAPLPRREERDGSLLWELRFSDFLTDIIYEPLLDRLARSSTRRPANVLLPHRGGAAGQLR